MEFIQCDFDPDFYFDYDDLDEEEQIIFQAMYNGNYDVAINRVQMALYVLAQKGYVKRDREIICNRNKITVISNERYIVVLCYGDHVDIGNEDSNNEITFKLTKDKLMADAEAIAEIIMRI